MEWAEQDRCAAWDDGAGANASAVELDRNKETPQPTIASLEMLESFMLMMGR